MYCVAVLRLGISQAFMYAFSMRERTHAHHHFVDDVPEEIKMRRLREVRVHRCSIGSSNHFPTPVHTVVFACTRPAFAGVLPIVLPIVLPNVLSWPDHQRVSGRLACAARERDRHAAQGCH